MSSVRAPSNTGVAKWTPAFRPFRELGQRLVRTGGLGNRPAAVDPFHDLAKASAPRPRPILVESLTDQLAETVGCPAEMGLQHLAHIHPRGHAERIEHDVNRRSIREKRHVFLGEHAADHALVSVAPCHLVARLKLSLHGNEHLDDLDVPGLQVIPALDLEALVVMPAVDPLNVLLVLREQTGHLLGDVSIADAEGE